MSETPDFALPPNQRGPDSAMARFYVKPVQNNFKSQAEGRPVFEDQEFVEILIPGDRRSAWDGMVKDEHRRRWPTAYAAFKESREVPSEGTPLSEWAAITRSQAEELAFQRVRTVEQLAALSDQQITNTIAMGGMALREKAQRWLEQANGAAPVEKLSAENKVLRDKNDALQDQLNAVLARVHALETGRLPSGAAPPEKA